MKKTHSTLKTRPTDLPQSSSGVPRTWYEKKILYPQKMVLVGVVILLFVAGCGKSVIHENWKVTANTRTCELSFSQENLGSVFQNVQLNVKEGNGSVKLTDWEIKKEKNNLLIRTEKPMATIWGFAITESGIDAECSVPDAFLSGIAPAGEKRIPARVASQDNGIMYTQMGFVSALNINHLFDMKTDIMIEFPKKSRLTRNCSDNSEMNIELPLTDGGEITLLKNYYTDVVGLAKYQQTEFKPVYKSALDNFKTAPTGWSTWYCYYMAPTEEDLVLETDALAKKLGPYGLEYVQLDACFTRGEEANWLEWTKSIFPKGGKWWFHYITERGLKPGLWVNLYGDNYAKPSMAEKYPDNFYLKDQNGDLSRCCCSADSTVVRLDYTNPAVIEKHLKPLFKTFVNDWGLKYLKSAGWGTWMDYYEENRNNAFNPEMDSREAYRSAQAAVREILGSDNYIVGCAMHEIGVGFDYYDGSRTGGDDFATWYGKEHWSDGMQTFFKSLFGANYLNGICWWSDPDAVMVRDPLTMDESETIVTTASLSGQAYIISDFIADFTKDRLQKHLSNEYGADFSAKYPDLVQALPDERLSLYRQTMPAMPIRAMDLYPFRVDPRCCPEPKEYPRALDLKVNSVAGMYDVVSLYNWDDEEMVKSLDLAEDLGLDTKSEYLVFDFWGRKLLNSVTTTLSVTIPAHGTKALIIRKKADRPQLLATSRHLTCAYSIESLNWDSTNLSLTGSSKTVPGDTYTMYVHLPENMELAKVVGGSENISHSITPERVLQVSFPGTKKPVAWEITFDKK